MIFLIKALVTVFGIGYIRIAPGTFGSLFAILVLYISINYLNIYFFYIIIIIVFICSFKAINIYLRKENKDFIYIGDSLKSIHPVAGQGWNLGIKDIQKLIMISQNYSLDNSIFNTIYNSNRILESTIYLSFTSFFSLGIFSIS